MGLVVSSSACTLTMAVHLLRPPAAERDVRAEPAALPDEPLTFDALYRRHVQIVFARLTRLVGPCAEREDLVQQVFVELYRALPGYRGEAPLGAFIHGITVRVGFDYLRRRTRKRAWAASEEAVSELVSCEGSPEQAAHEREQLRLAFQRLDALKPKKRVAFVLHVIEGLSLEEMSRMLDTDARTLGQRVAYARRELLAMVERDALRAREKGGV